MELARCADSGHARDDCRPTAGSIHRRNSKVTINRETWSTPELGAAAFTTVNMGVLSHRNGQALFWDNEQRKPTLANASWSEKWEARSKKHGKPNQVLGWQGGPGPDFPFAQ